MWSMSDSLFFFTTLIACGDVNLPIDPAVYVDLGGEIVDHIVMRGCQQKSLTGSVAGFAEAGCDDFRQSTVQSGCELIVNEPAGLAFLQQLQTEGEAEAVTLSVRELSRSPQEELGFCQSA